MNINDLHFDKKNYNRGTEQGDKLLDKSIRKFGYRQPAVIDKNGNIVAGNKRIAKAGELGIDEVNIVKGDPKKITVIQYDDFDLENDKLTKEYALADNQVAKVNIEIDIGLTFDTLGDKIPSDWGLELGFQVLETSEKDDEIPKVDNTIVKTVKGDIYEVVIGDCTHRVMCGDSTMLGDVEKLMDGALADLLHTDPPYNVNYHGGTSEKLTIKNDKMSNSDFKGFLVSVFLNCQLFMKSGASFYVYHADSEGYNFRGGLLEAGLSLKQNLIWNKSNMVMGRQDYHWKHEPILYGWKEGSAHKWYGDRKQVTVIDMDKPLRNAEHPTMKPVELCMYLITNSTKTKDLVLDLFGGSGSTAIACMKTGRNSNLMELDEHYCDVIITRIVNYCKDTHLNYLIQLNGKIIDI